MKLRLMALGAIGLASALIWTTLGTVSTAGAKEAPIIIARAHTGGRVPTYSKPLFILTLGGDARDGNPDHVRTDSIHIIGIDPVTLHASIIGIPRDSYVDIPGYGKDKINAAAFFGGAPLAVKTIEQLSGCHFDYYTLTSFKSFTKLVDQFGGVTVDVPTSMHEKCCSHVNLNAGVQHLDGTQALSFARDRHTLALGDFTRSVDQGLLIVSALAQAEKNYRTDPGSALRALAALRRNLIMNIPLLESVKLGLLMMRIKPANVTNQVIDGSATTVGGASIVQVSSKGLDELADICADGLVNQTTP